MTKLLVERVRKIVFVVMVTVSAVAAQEGVFAHHDWCTLNCSCGDTGCGAGQGTTCRTSTENGGTCYYTSPGQPETESLDCNSWCQAG